MPTEVEKDSHTGLSTTGHVWDGIKELDRPLPRWWLYVLWATVIWSIGYYVLYPAIPGLTGHTGGLLGWDGRQQVRDDIDVARAGQKKFRDAIAAQSLEDIRKDPDLLNFSLAGGRTAFADNCVPCHGAGATGARGYPSLADDVWLWGGTLDAIQTTIAHGIRFAGDDETRQSDMPRFGIDDVLSTEQIADVTEYVRLLGGKAEDTAAAKRGGVIFDEHCVACHGDDGTGNAELGAPNLADAVWLYGGEPADIRESVTNARAAVMPAWGHRLDATTIKMLTIYVHSLGGGQ